MWLRCDASEHSRTVRFVNDLLWAVMSTVARPIGELDLHLFGEGTHRRLWELLGPQGLVVDAHGDSHGVRFAVWAPNAAQVSVVGDWNGWSPEPLKMIDANGPTGIWSGLAPAALTGQRYKFEIITAQGRTLRKADPMARQTELPPSDASVIPSGSRHEWHDDEWMTSRRATILGDAPMRTYEVHLGSWRRGVDDWDTPRRRSQLTRALARLHPRRVDADRRASVRWLVGLPGVGVLRTDARASAILPGSVGSSTRCTSGGSA